VTGSAWQLGDGFYGLLHVLPRLQPGDDQDLLPACRISRLSSWPRELLIVHAVAYHLNSPRIKSVLRHEVRATLRADREHRLCSREGDLLKSDGRERDEPHRVTVIVEFDEHWRVDCDHERSPYDESPVGKALDVDDVVLPERHIERLEESPYVIRPYVHVGLDASSSQCFDETFDVGRDAAYRWRIVPSQDCNPHRCCGTGRVRS